MKHAAQTMLGDRLRQRAAAGDAEALRWLASFAPIVVPPRHLLAWRDAEIRRVALELFEVLPNPSRHAVALMLDAAGRTVQDARHLANQPEFAALIPEERARLEASVREITTTGVKWPRWRAIEDIL